MEISENAKIVLNRFLSRDKEGKIAETPRQLFQRIAENLAKEDARYNSSKKDIGKTEKEFFEMMAKFDFLPNLPVIANAGRKLQQLAACFTAEQPILTNPGLKTISDVQIGDKVITHTGEVKQVINKFIREIEEPVYNVGVQGIFRDTLSATSEHPILAAKRNDLRCIRKRNRLCNSFPKKLCYKKELEHKENCINLNNSCIKLKWIPVKDLEEGDFVAITTNKEIKDQEVITISELIPNKIYVSNSEGLIVRGRPNKGAIIPNKISVDNSLMRLFGYWLGDGSLSYHNNKPGVVRFTFNRKEENFCDDVLSIMKEKFGLTCKKELNKKQNTIQLRFNSVLLAYIFENLFGKGFRNKDIPEWIIYLPQEKQLALLVGLFRADGCYNIRKKQDRFFLSLSNYNLATKVWNILLRWGYNFSINSSKPKGSTATAYRISAAPSECEELVKAVNKKIYVNRKRFPQYIRTEGYILRPIIKINKMNFKGKVYNLEVEDNNSYIANGVAVHNCFVLPVPDDMAGIFQAVKEMAMIQKTGGGTGFSFSRLRPEGSYVSETGGIASGPVSFMKVFDAATGAIKEGGIRRGANIGILSVDHPDIEKFITCKEKGGLSNFNISVAITDEFMNAVLKDHNFDLKFAGKTYRTLRAKELFAAISRHAWLNGDPGIVFIDRINKFNPTPKLGEIESTNPCGEQPLLPYESCILGSINLSNFANPRSKKLDLKRLEKTIFTAVHFLDNSIEATYYPLPEIEKIVKGNRKIGLGVMGLADSLIKMQIPYDSEKAEKFAEKTMKFIKDSARKASENLAKQRGSFPNKINSIFKNEKKPLRNATLTTIAPAGTIAIIANCSEGIEPLFNLIFTRNSTYGAMLEANNLFMQAAKKLKLSYEDMEKIGRQGTLQNILKIPDNLKKVFKTAHDIPPEWHLRIQAAFQKYTDNAVSKTVNIPQTAKPEDIENIFLLAYKLGLKGLTVYRYASRKEQILEFCKTCNVKI